MIIVTGSIGFDYIMDFPGRFADRIMPEKIHQISLSFLVDDLKKQWGGTAGNISYSLGLLDTRPTLFATAGNDFAPYKKFLEKNNVDTHYVKEHKDISTGSYFVITDTSDNQIGAFYTGAMRHAKNLRLTTIFKKDSPSKDSPFVIIAPNDPGAMCQYVDECIAAKVPYLYDPAFQTDTFTPTQLKKAVSHAAILIGNDYEIELIAKKLNVTKEKLLSLVPIMITTLGEKGAVITCHSREGGNLYNNWIPGQARNDTATIQIKPSKAKKMVDPTGAGDCFRSGFLAGFTRGFDLQTCGQMGAVAAVYTVEKYGTTTHSFSIKEFSTRYKENYKTTLNL